MKAGVVFLLAMATVTVVSATTTFSPAALDAYDIRNGGGARLTISSDVSIFNILAPKVVMPSSAANETASVLFASATDDVLADAIAAGGLKISIVSTSSVTVALAVTGEYFAYQDSTLCVTILRALFALSATAQAPFTACVRIPAQESVVKQPREITVGVLGGISLVLALVGKDSHNALLSLGRQSLIGRLLECTDDLDFILHPTQLVFNSSAVYGCLMMNISIVFLLALFHTTVLRQFPKIFSPFLPGDHLVFLLAAFAGTTISTYEVVIQSAAPVRWALALVILFITYLALLGCLYLTMFDNATLKFSPRFSVWTHSLDPNFVQRWRVLFKPYRGGMVRWYFLLELIMSGIIAIACALPQTSETSDGCYISALIVVIIIAVDLTSLLLMWPYHSGVESIFAVLLKITECTVAAVTLVDTQKPNVDDALVIGGNSVLIFGAVVVLAKYMSAVFIAARGGPQIDQAAGEYVELMEREQRAQEEMVTKGILKSPALLPEPPQLQPSPPVSSVSDPTLLTPRQRGKTVVIVAGPDEGLPPPKGSPYPVKQTPPRPVIPPPFRLATDTTDPFAISPLVTAVDTEEPAVNKGMEAPSVAAFNKSSTQHISPLPTYAPEVLPEPVELPATAFEPEGKADADPLGLDDVVANHVAKADTVTAVQEWRKHTDSFIRLQTGNAGIPPPPPETTVVEIGDDLVSSPSQRLLDVPTEDPMLWDTHDGSRYSPPRFVEVEAQDVTPPTTQRPRVRSMVVPQPTRNVIDDIMDDLDMLLQ